MLWVLILILLIIMVVTVLLKARSKHEPAEYPYQKADSLFSPAERSLLGVLEKAVGDKSKVLGKVRLADIISPSKGLSKGDRQTALNRIVSKHIDFALCATDDLSLVCAIELDDSSHRRNERKTRDDFLEKALAAASIPFVRFTARASYSIQEVRSQIAETTGLDLQVSPNALRSVQASAGKLAQDDEAATCPKCGSPMVLRKAASGKYAGKRFWGCSRYPECRTLFPVKEDPISHA
jgi:hypothetical protein